jgi:AraC family transcriptional regulator
MDVTIVDQPELRIAGIRHTGPYQNIGQTFARLGGIINGPLPAGAKMVALYHDDPGMTPPDRLRSDAGITLAGNAGAPAGLIEQRIAPGRYARALHQGSYEGLPAAWDRLKNEWLPQNGHHIGHPSYELYLNTPMTVPPADLRTELYIRLA